MPRWAIATAGLLTLLTVVLAALVLAAGDATGWLALGSTAACLGAVGLLVRVAVGIGFGWLGAAALMAANRMPLNDVLVIVGSVAQLGAILTWVWLTTPSRPSLAAS